MNTNITVNSASSAGEKRNIRELVATWEESELTQKEFCNRHNILYHQFQYWRKQSKPVKSKKHKNFVSLIPHHRVGDSGMRQPVMAVIYPDGKQVNFYTAAKPSLLRLLIG